MSAIYIPVVLGLLGIHKRHIFFCDIKEKINKEPFLSLSACYAHVLGYGDRGTGPCQVLADLLTLFQSGQGEGLVRLPHKLVPAKFETHGRA